MPTALPSRRRAPFVHGRAMIPIVYRFELRRTANSAAATFMPNLSAGCPVSARRGNLYVAILRRRNRQFAVGERWLGWDYHATRDDR